MTATARGSREVPAPRRTVWQALAVLSPYCAVCDVSYVVAGKPRKGTTFVCVPGRLGDEQPADGSPEGEILEWEPNRLVTTRLRLTPETWTTRLELADAGPDATRVTITLTQEPVGGSRLVHLVQRGTMRRTVRRMVDGELDKLPAHIAQAAESG